MRRAIRWLLLGRGRRRPSVVRLTPGPLEPERKTAYVWSRLGSLLSKLTRRHRE